MRGRLFVTALVISSVAFLPAPADAGTGNYPIVLIPGWHGNADTFREMVPQLTAQGFTVLDFDTATPGIQAMGYAPTASGQHISYIAGKIVEEKIVAALTAAGYGSSQKIDIIAHSMGGLAARFLVEKGGADVDHWSASTGWYGDGIPDVATDWATRVDDLIMLGTPNHGTWEGWVPATIGGFGNWNPSGGDMFTNSKFLTLMGYAEKAGEEYRCIGGDPQYLQWLQFNYDGGASHGFDGVVPAESPYVTGCTMDYVAGHHGELVTTDQAIDLVITMLGQTSYQAGVGQANLVGDAIIRLEKFYVNNDHDSGTTDDYKLDVYIDTDSTLGGAGYTYLGRVSHGMNGPGTVNWGNTGPTVPAIKLSGNYPVVDVKVVVLEDDTSWGGGYESVSTHYFTNLLLSEDIDGQDHYKAFATDSKGGQNEIRLSLNGITSDVSLTRYVTLGLDKAYIKDDHDCCWGAGEVQFTMNAGRAGFTSVVYRGDPGTNTHYSRHDPAWVDIGVHTKNNGAVESEKIWAGRMHKDAMIRFDVTYWEDDGGWSGRDGGNMYYLDKSLPTLVDGKTTYQGTSLPDYNVYIWVDKAPFGAGGSGTVGLALTPIELDAWLDPMSLVPNGPDDPPGEWNPNLPTIG